MVIEEDGVPRFVQYINIPTIDDRHGKVSFDRVRPGNFYGITFDGRKFNLESNCGAAVYKALDHDPLSFAALALLERRITELWHATNR